MANNNAGGQTPLRPLPKLDELDTKAFWEATKAKTFTYQQCANCNTVIWYPRQHCTGCVDGDLQLHTASGKGTVYSFSVVRQSYHPFFRHLVPYAVAWVDLDEGPRVLSNIVGVSDPSTDINIGDAVVIEWEEHAEVCIPLFKPAT